MENYSTQFLNSTASAVNSSTMPADNHEFLKNLPPGFHFRPTDEELIASYLIKKLNNQKLPPNLIHDIDVYKSHPKTLSEKYKLEGENDMYFFSPRERKYKNGNRPSRAAQGGYWKATVANKPIKLNNGKQIGCKRSLVFFSGKVPNGEKTSWIMHEFTVKNLVPRGRTHEGDMTLDNWVLCRIHYNDRKSPSKKKNRRADEMNDQEPCNDTNQVLVTEQEKQPMAEPESCSNNMGDSYYYNPNNFFYFNPSNCFPNVKSYPSIHPDNAGTSSAINPSLIKHYLPAVGQVEVNNNGNPMMFANFGVPSFDVPIRLCEEQSDMADSRLFGSGSLVGEGPIMIEKRKVDFSGLSGLIVEKAPAYGYKRPRYSNN